MSVVSVAMAWAFFRLSASVGTQYRQNFQASARRNLADLFLFIEPRRLFLLHSSLVLAIFLIALLWSGNVLAAFVAGVVVGASPPAIYAFLRKRRYAQIVNDLPDTLMAIATSMRSGLSLNQSLETVIAHDTRPLAQELELLLRELRVGADYHAALDGLYRRVPVIEIQLLTSAMRISREIGGNLSEMLDRMSSTLRNRLQMEGKIKSLTAQGKLQGLVMTALPVFLILILRKMEPFAMHFLFNSWYGWAVVGVLVVMLTIGYRIIRKIVDIDV